MNPASPDFSNRTASSPALFNRCVIDWFGDWTDSALNQVASDYTRFLVPEEKCFIPGEYSNANSRKQGLVNSLVNFHLKVVETNSNLRKKNKIFNYITPRVNFCL